MITAKQLTEAYISGANNIENNRQKVDALNVFPVPDGDTGTNMSMTMGAAREDLLHNDYPTVGDVAGKAASALLRGARGNSGVITSLLFRGFSKGLKHKSEAGAADLVEALEIGVAAAYKAVMKPTEGTILTVARVAAEKSRTALTALGDYLPGDEESVCKALTLAGKILEKNLAAARDHRQETEKRSAALWLSSAALLVILLI